MTQTTLSKTGQSFDQDGYIAIQPLFDAAKMQEINRELDRFIVECVPKMTRGRPAAGGPVGEADVSSKVAKPRRQSKKMIGSFIVNFRS